MHLPPCILSLRDHSFHIILFTANCGHPKPPFDGYVLPYTSTVEGARVIFACQNITHKQALEPKYSAQCSSTGKWEPNSTELCIHSI